MAQELYQAVHKAEENADRMIQEAHQKARDLIKETEAEIKAGERKAALAHRAKYQSILEEKRQTVQTQIEEQRPQATKAQQERLDEARAKLDQASQMIVERIWNDGDR